MASAVSTGDGLLFRGSDGVGESWQCLDVADSSSRIFYIAFRQRDVQYCSMWFHYFRKNKLVSYCSSGRKQKQHEATIPKPRIPRSPKEVFAVACLCSIPMVSAFAAALLCCAEPSGRHPAWPSSPRYFQVLAVFAVLEALGLNRVY